MANPVQSIYGPAAERMLDVIMKDGLQVRFTSAQEPEQPISVALMGRVRTLMNTGSSPFACTMNRSMSWNDAEASHWLSVIEQIIDDGAAEGIQTHFYCRYLTLHFADVFHPSTRGQRSAIKDAYCDFLTANILKGMELPGFDAAYICLRLGLVVDDGLDGPAPGPFDCEYFDTVNTCHMASTFERVAAKQAAERLRAELDKATPPAQPRALKRASARL